MKEQAPSPRESTGTTLLTLGEQWCPTVCATDAAAAKPAPRGAGVSAQKEHWQEHCWASTHTPQALEITPTLPYCSFRCLFLNLWLFFFSIGWLSSLQSLCSPGDPVHVTGPKNKSKWSNPSGNHKPKLSWVSPSPQARSPCSDAHIYKPLTILIIGMKIMYLLSFMCHFSKLERIAHYKAKNQTV